MTVRRESMDTSSSGGRALASQDLEASRRLTEIVERQSELGPSDTAVHPGSFSTSTVSMRMGAVIELLSGPLEMYDDARVADYLFDDPMPQHVPDSWVRALNRTVSVEDPGLQLPWLDPDTSDS